MLDPLGTNLSAFSGWARMNWFRPSTVVMNAPSCAHGVVLSSHFTSRWNQSAALNFDVQER